MYNIEIQIINAFYLNTKQNTIVIKFNLNQNYRIY